MKTRIDDFIEAYIIAALWSSNDNSTPSGGEPLDKNYSERDLSPETRRTMIVDCLDFLSKAFKIDGFVKLDLAQCGHDFWLTRNGHGTGFWDRDLGQLGEILTNLCKTYSESNLYVARDTIYLI